MLLKGATFANQPANMSLVLTGTATRQLGPTNHWSGGQYGSGAGSGASGFL